MEQGEERERKGNEGAEGRQKERGACRGRLWVLMGWVGGTDSHPLPLWFGVSLLQEEQGRAGLLLPAHCRAGAPLPHTQHQSCSPDGSPKSTSWGPLTEPLLLSMEKPPHFRHPWYPRPDLGEEAHQVLEDFPP